MLITILIKDICFLHVLMKTDENSERGRVGLFAKIVLACVAGVLRGQVVKRYKLELVYPTSHVWCRVILDDGGRQVDSDKNNMNFFFTVERKALQAAEAVTVVDKIVFRTCREAWHLCNNKNSTGGDINTCKLLRAKHMRDMFGTVSCQDTPGKTSVNNLNFELKFREWFDLFTSLTAPHPKFSIMFVKIYRRSNSSHHLCESQF